jgi:hypothetical protein
MSAKSRTYADIYYINNIERTNLCQAVLPGQVWELEAEALRIGGALHLHSGDTAAFVRRRWCGTALQQPRSAHTVRVPR